MDRKFYLAKSKENNKLYDLWTLEELHGRQYRDRHLANSITEEELATLAESAQEALDEMQGNVRCVFPDCDWAGPLGAQGSQFLAHFVCAHSSHVGER